MSHLQTEGPESLRRPHSAIRNATHIQISEAANGSIYISSTCSKRFTWNESVKELNVPAAEFFIWTSLTHICLLLAVKTALLNASSMHLLMYLMQYSGLSLKIRLVIHHTCKDLVYKEYPLLQYSSVSVLVFNKMFCWIYQIITMKFHSSHIAFIPCRVHLFLYFLLPIRTRSHSTRRLRDLRQKCTLAPLPRQSRITRLVVPSPRLPLPESRECRIPGKTLTWNRSCASAGDGSATPHLLLLPVTSLRETSSAAAVEAVGGPEAPHPAVISPPSAAAVTPTPPPVPVRVTATLPPT